MLAIRITLIDTCVGFVFCLDFAFIVLRSLGDCGFSLIIVYCWVLLVELMF